MPARERSAIAEPGVNSIRYIDWEGAARVDHASRRSIAEHQGGCVHPDQQHINRDVGLELPDCWVATLKALTKRTLYAP